MLTDLACLGDLGKEVIQTVPAALSGPRRGPHPHPYSSPKTAYLPGRHGRERPGPGLPPDRGPLDFMGAHSYAEMNQLPRTAPALMSLHGEWPRAKLRSVQEKGAGPSAQGTHYISHPGSGDDVSAFCPTWPLWKSNKQSCPFLKIN